MLTWKKRKDGTLIAKTDKGEYTIVPARRKAGGYLECHFLRLVLAYEHKKVRKYKTLWSSPELFAPGADHLKRAKDSCKRVAEEHAKGTGPLYQRVLMSLPLKLKPYFVWWAEGVKDTPEVDGPGKSKFLELAEKGIRPTWGWVHDKWLKKLGLKHADLPYEYLTTLELLTFLPCHLHDRKRAQKDLDEFRRRHSMAPRPVGPEKPPANRPQSTTEEYKGPSPEERERSDRRRLYTPTQSEPCPFFPEDAKFSTLLKWGEKVRDYYELRGRHVTVQYLKYAAGNTKGWNLERQNKAAKRLELIYAKDWRQEKANMQAMYERSLVVEPEQKEEKKKGKAPLDKWGYKEGSRAARINAVLTKVPKTAKQIERESKATSVSGHLSALVKKKLVRKIGNKFRLRKQPK